MTRSISDDALDSYRRLVEQPSHTYAPADVEDAFAIYDALMKDCGLSTHPFPSADARFANHRLYLSPAASKENLGTCLVGHIDTVFPRDTGFLHFKKDGQKVYGPGVLDMKGGLIVIAEALKQVGADRLTQTPISVLVVSEEEVGSPDSSRLYKQHAPHMEEALVFEGGRQNNDVVTKRKGAINIKLSIQGEAAHAGNCYQEGQSALLAGALLVPDIEAQTKLDKGTTINVGILNAGTAKNVVPEHASMLIDCRFEQNEERERVLAYFSDGLKAHFKTMQRGRPRIERCLLSIEVLSERPVLDETDASRSLAMTYLDIQKQLGLNGIIAPLQGGGSDANLVAAYGVPTIDGLGPFGTGFHSSNEWADLDNMAIKIEALKMFLEHRLKNA